MEDGQGLDKCVLKGCRVKDWGPQKIGLPGVHGTQWLRDRW